MPNPTRIVDPVDRLRAQVRAAVARADRAETAAVHLRMRIRVLESTLLAHDLTLPTAFQDEVTKEAT